MIGDEQDVNHKEYLDQKFGELRKASIAGAAATIYVKLLSQLQPLGADATSADEADRLEELEAKAAHIAVRLFHMV